MAKRKTKPKQQPVLSRLVAWPFQWLRRWARLGLRMVLGLALLLVVLVALFAFVGPPTTLTIWSEGRKNGGVERDWVAFEDIAPSAVRAVVAAEDANFCRHWGFDVKAIRAALDDGAQRGASTITQQTVKNVFLWQGRSWPRKVLETALTPLVEAVWSKRRILEVYLNVAEFGTGVFGIEAAARHYFSVNAADLTPAQGARLAVILPSPKSRDPARLPPWLQKQALRVQDGADTIKLDGRAMCFES